MFFFFLFVFDSPSFRLHVGLSKSIIRKFVVKIARGSKILSHFNFGNQNVLKMFETKLKFSVSLNRPLKGNLYGCKKKQNKKTNSSLEEGWMGQKHDFS